MCCIVKILGMRILICVTTIHTQKLFYSLRHGSDYLRINTCTNKFVRLNVMSLSTVRKKHMSWQFKISSLTATRSKICALSSIHCWKEGLSGMHCFAFFNFFIHFHTILLSIVVSPDTFLCLLSTPAEVNPSFIKDLVTNLRFCFIP